MATVGVVAFRNGSPHSKVQVLQDSINNMANKANVNNGDKREIIILRKKPRLLPTTLKPAPQTVSVASLINSQNSALVQNSALISARGKKASTKAKENAGRVHNPPPIAVARRNARERNRVKQVNNGFATLRQHIPNEIAEIYENANNNRSANKKLSKVETLRMAVEYIRSLECLLSIDGDSKENSANLSMASFPSPASSESLPNSSSFDQSYYSMQSPMLEEDEDSNPPTPLPPVGNHHYSRIPGTNTFQLIPGPAPLHHYEDEENIHPLTPNSDLISHEDMLIHQNLIDPNMDFIQTSAQEFTVMHPDMISSDFYSESSLSPHQDSDYMDVKYDPIIGVSGQQVLYPNSLILPNSPPVPLTLSESNRLPRMMTKDGLLITSQSILREKIVYANEMDLKQEPEEISRNFQNNISGNENMEDVISWWQAEKGQQS